MAIVAMREPGEGSADLLQIVEAAAVDCHSFSDQAQHAAAPHTHAPLDAQPRPDLAVPFAREGRGPRVGADGAQKLGISESLGLEPRRSRYRGTTLADSRLSWARSSSRGIPALGTPA